MTETTETPQKTLLAATKINVLPLLELTLIGTVETPIETRALVRQRNGRVKVMKSGDEIDGHHIVAVETSALIIAREGQAHRLEIPERPEEMKQSAA